jgi:type I restriction enzyme, S subunit
MSSDAADAVTDEGDQARALVPKLRFPEFRDAGAWSFKPLSALGKRKSKRNASEEIVRVLTNSAEHGVVDQKDYFEKDIAVQGNLETYFIVDVGDYVYNPRISSMAPVGPIGKNKVGTGVMSPLYTVFGFDNGNDDFYEHYFRSTYWHGYLRHASNSGARHDRMAISNDAFMEMPLPTPSPTEQQKIADCLSSLDAVIAAEGDRLAALKDHKKGLMQQLFPRPERSENGVKIPPETTPRLRFPEFQDAGDWEEKPLGEICKIQRGKFSHRPRNDPRFFGGKYPFIQTGDVVKSNGGQVEASQSLNDRGLSVSKLFKPPIVLITIAANIGDTGMLEQEACFTDSVVGLTPKKDVCPYFLESIVREKKHFLNQIAPAAAQKNINNEILSELLMLLPAFVEQKRISGFLSSIDNLVTAQSDKLDALKAHKAGLMQQLFPSPAEAAA